MSLAYSCQLDYLVEAGDYQPWIAGRHMHQLDRFELALRGHSKRIPCLTPMPDDHFVLSGAEDGAVRLWDLTTDDPGGRVFKLKSAPRLISWSPGSDQIWIETVSENMHRLSEPMRPTLQDMGPTFRHPAILIPLDAERILGVGKDGQCYRYADGNWESSVRLSIGMQRSAVLQDRNRLTYLEGHTVRAANLADGEEIWNHELDEEFLNHIRLLPNGDILVSSQSGPIYRLAATDGSVMCQNCQRNARVSWIDVAEGGNKLAIAANDYQVHILDTETLQESATFVRPNPPLRVWFIDDDQRLRIVDEHTATVVSTKTGQNPLTTKANFDEPAALSPDRRWLVSRVGDYVRLLRLRWD